MQMSKDQLFQVVEQRGEDDNGEELFVLHQQHRVLKAFDMQQQFQAWKRTAGSYQYLDTAGRLKPGHGQDTVRWVFLCWLAEKRFIVTLPEPLITLVSIDQDVGPVTQPTL